MSLFFFKLPWKKQDKGVWDLLFIIPLLHVPCAQLPLEVLHRLGFQIRNEPPLYEWLKTSVVRQLKFLAMQGNRSGAVAKWWPLWGSFRVFFWKECVGSLAYICMKMLLQDKLLVTSVYKNRMDWMWLIKMTCSSAFLNYLNLVKRLGVLMDCIGLNHLHSWYQCWSQSKFTQFCRHLWRPRRGNNMQVLRQRNAEYIGVKVAMAILPLAWKSPRQGHVIVGPYRPYLNHIV